MTTRRNFLILLGANGLFSPGASFAKQSSIHRIGWLSNERAGVAAYFDAFRSGMRDLGYVEGRNLVIEARFGEGSAERLEKLGVELVQLKPQIIVTSGGRRSFRWYAPEPPCQSCLATAAIQSKRTLLTASRIQAAA